MMHPYLMSVLDADCLQASQLNMVLPIGFILGSHPGGHSMPAAEHFDKNSAGLKRNF